MTEEYEPIKYQDIKHNYEARMKKRPQRFTDNSMAMGGIVLAGIIFFLVLLYLVVS